MEQTQEIEKNKRLAAIFLILTLIISIFAFTFGAYFFLKGFADVIVRLWWVFWGSIPWVCNYLSFRWHLGLRFRMIMLGITVVISIVFIFWAKGMWHGWSA